MPNESTPLIQTVRVGPPRHRYPHNTCRRFFSIASCCLLITGFAYFAIHAAFVWPYEFRHGRHSHFSYSPGRKGKEGLKYKDLVSILMDTPSTENLEKWFHYYTEGAHLAGTNLSQVEWTRDKWEEWGVPSEIVSYESYINYPLEHSLSLLEKSKGSGKSEEWDLLFEASLEEDVLEEDPMTGYKERSPTFHGYSASGNVTAPFVYVNYGTYQDYQDLVDLDINLEGKIAVAKYGGNMRGLKVKRAQELGMVGVLMYSDPGDDGEITIENGYDYYPNGPARNPSSVQRGSAEFLSIQPGDPTTPGYPSKPGVPRGSPDDAIPSIPSIPISYTDALPILKALNGHGPRAKSINKYWNRNNGLGYKGVKYNIGPSPNDVVLNLNNQQNYTTAPMRDVIGIVNGTISNEVLIIGNHRDAWSIGGADPNSGSAALNEVIRSVGKALEAGWKPLRTIVFASWDGEEYGLIGSTEWVEEYLPWLQDANVAYLNVDIAVSGSELVVGATPTLNNVMRDILQQVQSPNQTIEGQTVGDLWSGLIHPLGSGSDFTAFQDYAGVPCLALTFGPKDTDPVYHYHSNYDSFRWMQLYGDPGFKYHKAMTQMMSMTMANLVENIVLPFRASEYADALGSYLDDLEDKLKGDVEAVTDDEISALRGLVTSHKPTGSEDEFRESLDELHTAIAEFRDKALEIDDLAAWTEQELEADIPWWNIHRKMKLARTIVKVNFRYKFLERTFLFEDGLDGRNWFKHVVYAPGLWTGYSGAVYPGLSESIDTKDYERGLKWSGIIKSCIEKATKSLS